LLLQAQMNSLLPLQQHWHSTMQRTITTTTTSSTVIQLQRRLQQQQRQQPLTLLRLQRSAWLLLHS
jgi:hypothetical protein